LVIGAAVPEEPIPKVIHFDGAVDGGGSQGLYPSIYTGPVLFSHEKHYMDYGAKCGDCHHNSDGEPIVGFGSHITFTCEDCHDEEGLIRGPIAENNATDSDLIAHRSNVLHMQCIGCHKVRNNLKRVVRVPESCKTCHARHPQSWVIK
jgi:hypothetical protein